MKQTKKRIKAPAVPAPATLEDAEFLLGEIGLLQREVVRIETVMNDQLSAIKEDYEREAQKLNEFVNDKFEALHIFAEANRAVLLKGNLKTASLATGEISWRMTPPKVTVTGAAKVIERLKSAGLFDLVRVAEEVDKNAILADRKRVQGIKGIMISQKEEFVAKPYESQIEKAVAKIISEKRQADGAS